MPSAIVSDGSSWTYAYNNRRLLTQESLNLNGSGYAIGRAYDAYGHLSQLTYPDGAVIAYAPNALGEATQASGYASGVHYFPNGAVAGYTLANGIVHSAAQNTRGLTLQNTDSGVLQDQYAYDADGNIASIVDQLQGISNRSMAYDGLDRLVAANAPGVWGGASYAYDQLDNLRTSVVGGRSSVHDYDASNRLSTINTNGTYTGYAFDNQGNVTARGTSGYYFDQGNRLRSSTYVEHYSYDGLGRRTAIYKDSGINQYQVYSQAGQLLFSTWQQGYNASTARWIYLGGHAIAQTNSATGTEYLHDDLLGSPVARSDSSGALTSQTRYEPYGETAAGTTPTNLGFTGHVNDADTGLVYMQQRYYDPLAGRFQSVDPVVTDASTGKGFGRYTYVDNNPYRYTDPDGRSALDIGFFVFDAVNFGVAAYTGAGVGEAAINLGISALGVASPIPGLGEAIKGVRIAEKGVEVARGVDKVGEAAKGVEKTASGGRVGDFTRGQKDIAKAENATANGGQMKCTDCGKAVESIKSEKGVPTPGNQAQVHHDPAIKDGGGQHSTPVVVCPDCHRDRH